MKRVRLLINKATPLPAECVQSLAGNSDNHFQEWRKAVIGAGRAVAREQVGGVISKLALKPPLRGSLEYLQFSPDGRYLLAQDEQRLSCCHASRSPLSSALTR